MASSIKTALLFLFLITIFNLQKGLAQKITAPENLVASPTSQNEIDLTWDDSNKNKTYYVIERSVANENNFQEVAVLNNKASSYSDMGLTENTMYYYRVKAVIQRIFNQSTAYSNITIATTFPDPPIAPTDLKAVTSWQSEVTVSWKDNSNNEDGFSLERSEMNSSNFTNIATLPPNTSSYNDKNLKSNTTYFYRIRSFNLGGHSTYSEQAFTTTYQLAPTLDPIPDPAAIPENSDTQELILTGISDGGDGGQAITITATSSNQELMPDPQIVYNSPANTAKLRYRTNRNHFGTSTITVTVKDDGSSEGPVKNFVTQSFKITVYEINDPPTLDNIAKPAAIFENSETQTIPLTGISAGFGEEDQTVTITATSSNPEIIPHPVVNYTNPQTTGTLSFKPAPNKFGKVTITVTVKDNGSSTSPNVNTFQRSFEVTVLYVNKAPTIDPIASPSAIQHSSGEQTMLLTGITAGPNDNQKITVTATTNNPGIIKNLSVEYTSPQSTATLRYSPVPDQLGKAEITVTVKDDGPNTAPHVNTTTRSFTVTVTDIPLIANQTFPEYYTSASNDVIGITVHENITVDNVELHYRPLNENEWKVKLISPNGLKYNVPTPADSYFGPIGMEYFFVVNANGTLQEQSTEVKTYLNYSGNGLPIPDLKFGDTEAHYQIVAIPLEQSNKSIPYVFEDNLGPYNPTQWRLFHYLDSAVEYPTNFNSIAPGKGYWLIVRREKGIDTGEGSTFKVDRDSPFIINLKKGWNQIGNPYNMDVNWSEVLQTNSNVSGVGKLNVFEDGTLKESDVLRKFRGGFVFSENETSISIPVIIPVNGRFAEKFSESVKEDGWEINMQVVSSGSIHSSGGLGMRTDALLGKDHYDEAALPRFGFLKQVNFNFEHPEYFYPHFSKDIVPTADNHIWEFTVQSSSPGELLSLEWNTPQLNEGNDVILVDIASNKVVDMRKQLSYSFSSGKDTKFKVYYGDSKYLLSNIKPEHVSFDKPYPNPFLDNITFSFAVAPSESKIHIQLTIYDVTGRIVATPADKEYLSGFHEAQWDGSNSNGKKLAHGVYVYKMTITGDNILKEHKGRIVLK
ncbi:MAG: fibronectin type III domain-containing protein [Bacteroidota bacterium]|nr:fibronectin type III domain-containing protein [Bacteroidota bacterium]